MDIPLNAEVRCADGLCGRSTYVIVNPVTRKVTHVVVEERAFPHTEYLAPLELVAESTPTLIRLSCTARDLIALDSFVDVEFVPGEPFSDDDYAGEEVFLWPYALPDAGGIPEEHERIPPGELAVRRGVRVEATDGHVGRVDEFLVDPESELITHLILREGHLWGQKDVTIPVSQIGRIDEDTVHLKLGREQIEALPAIRVRRS
jgi:hypothetical protein